MVRLHKGATLPKNAPPRLAIDRHPRPWDSSEPLGPICAAMEAAGLPQAFGREAATVAIEYDGVGDLMRAWADAEDDAGRRMAIVLEIEELIGDLQSVYPHEWQPSVDRRAVTDAAGRARAAKGYSDHQRFDARSLAMHTVVAKKLLAKPALIAQARSTLARWRAQAAKPVPSYFLEWGRVLEGSTEEIAAFLASTCEDATRLRQYSPFTDLLTPEERAVIYDAFQSQKTGSILGVAFTPPGVPIDKSS
jgi:hypothetical protein